MMDPKSDTQNSEAIWLAGLSSESHAMAVASSDKASWKLCSRAGVMLTEAADRRFVSSPKF